MQCHAALWPHHHEGLLYQAQCQLSDLTTMRGYYHKRSARSLTSPPRGVTIPSAVLALWHHHHEGLLHQVQCQLSDITATRGYYTKCSASSLTSTPWGITIPSAVPALWPHHHEGSLTFNNKFNQITAFRCQLSMLGFSFYDNCCAYCIQ